MLLEAPSVFCSSCLCESVPLLPEHYADDLRNSCFKPSDVSLKIFGFKSVCFGQVCAFSSGIRKLDDAY